MASPVVIIVEVCTSYVGSNANPRNYQDHYQDFIQCMANVPLPLDVTLICNQATVELLEWLRDKKQLKSMKGGKQLWGPANLEQERHRAGEFPRIGAFEVYILSSASGPKGSTCLVHEAYSKLHHGRWPTVPLLVSKICKTLGRIKKRENTMPRCSTIWLNSIGKLFDVHGHPPGMTTGQLLIPSLRCWVHPEVEGELLSAEFKPHNVDDPLQLCDVTPGMRIRAINLRHCDIKYSVAKEVAHFVSKASSLQSLSLRDNDIDGMGATCIANALVLNGNISSVDLRGNRIGPSGGTAIAEMLRNNTSVKQMNLYGNGLESEGGEAIAKALKRNQTLTTLDLGDNRLGDVSSTKIAEALKGTTSLTSLQMQPLNDLHPGASGMGDPRRSSGCVALVNGLKETPSLHTLNIGANSILCQWDQEAQHFPHKMITPSLWKGRQTLPAAAATAGHLACTRTKLLERPNDLRQPLIPVKKDDLDAVKKPLLAAEYTAKRKALYKTHEGPLFDQVCQLHQLSLANLSVKPPRLSGTGPM